MPSLKAIHLGNFKSYRQATLPIAPFTVLIGANASGKSNALEALRFLHGIATGRYLDEVYKDLTEAGVLRGHREELVWEKGERFSLGVSVGLNQGEAEMRWDLEVLATRELVVYNEKLTYGKESVPTFESERKEEAPPHTLLVRYNNFARGGIKPSLWVDDRQAAFTQLNTPAKFTTPKAQERIPQRVETLRQVLKGMYFLEPRPARMRGYAPIESEVRLAPGGQNVSAVLYDVCVQKGRTQDVLDFVRELPEGEIVAIDFIKTERNDVMLRVTEEFGPHRQTWDAAILSDGTLRVLAIAAALLSAPPGSLLVIEEIDNGVHPSRAEMLIKKMQQIVAERSLRVLLTTHNPALLDALPLELYSDVVYCYRDLREGDSRLIRLIDLPNYPELMMQGTLGNLLQRRVLERAVREPESPDERKRRNLAWLASWLQEENAK